MTSLRHWIQWRKNRMRTFIVDSFTNTPFKGNPAGVCLIDSQLSDERMLHIAQELNLFETAFLSPLESRDAFAIRFFSPKMEIALCGHATLASAKVVFSLQNLKEALGIKDIRNSVYNEETKILLLEIADAEELAGLDPDFAALQRSHNFINGSLVTAPAATDGYDFHSRYFWPWSGTNEDPVTGGTHTFLAKYWSSRLGKTRMKSFQSSKRTGFMDVELVDDKLFIRAQAVIVVFEGRLAIES